MRRWGCRMPKPKSSAPWMPISYVGKKADVAALQAMRRGEANADQQLRAMEFILETICDRNGMSYRPGPDGDRDTSFAEGRRFCGNQIVKLTKLPLSKIKDEPK